MRVRTSPWFLASVCAWLLLGLGARGATYRRITNEGPWGNYEAFPDICKLADGSLFVVFYAGKGHVTLPNENSPRGGAIYGLRSTDAGQTWSAPILVADTPADDRDPHLGQLRDGALLATFFTYTPYKGPGGWGAEGEVFVVRSTDGGLTWAQPEIVPTPYKDKEGIPAIFESGSPVQLKDDHVILPIYVEKVKDHYITVMAHSRDGGKTWTDFSEVDPEQSLGFSYGFCEASLTRVSDGRLITLLRPGMHQSYSSDEGYTWTKATKLPVTGDAPGVLFTSSKLLVATFRYGGTSAMISADDGATWGRPWQIDTVGGAYSNQVELADGAILCVYYEEGAGSSIRTAVFTIEPRVAPMSVDERWPVPIVGNAIDLRALYALGKVKITTDMDFKDPVQHPGSGPEAAFDGSTEYLRSAWKRGPAPATYQLELDQEYTLATLGICLKAPLGTTEHPESAQIFLSSNGTDWGEPAVTLDDAATSVVWNRAISPPRPARFVKVVISKSTGWAGLNELLLYAK
jgi:sialidase-1